MYIIIMPIGNSSYVIVLQRLGKIEEIFFSLGDFSVAYTNVYKLTQLITFSLQVSLKVIEHLFLRKAKLYLQ